MYAYVYKKTFRVFVSFYEIKAVRCGALFCFLIDTHTPMHLAEIQLRAAHQH